MPINSRQKGAAAEREWRDVLRAAGYSAERGQQHSGSPDSPDVKCPDMPGYHCEVKRVEKFQLYDAMDQATRDAGADRIPYVAHRRNHKKWVVVLWADDFLDLVEDAYDV